MRMETYSGSGVLTPADGDIDDLIFAESEYFVSQR